MGEGSGRDARAVTTRPAPDYLIWRYLRGGCFTLAYEAARISGLPLMGLRDETGAVHHAFVADPETGEAWDIRGRCPVSRISAGCAMKTSEITPLPSEEVLSLLGHPDPYAQDTAARAVRAHLLADGLPVRPDLRVPLPEAGATGEPDAATAKLYTWGACHLFAIAAVDMFAAEAIPLGFRVVTDLEEPFWTSETDPDDKVPAVVHVYAVLRGPQGEVAVDVYGVRPLTEALAECAKRFGTRRPGFEDFPDLEALRDLIEDEDDPDGADRRPLWPIRTEEVEGARKAAARIFGFDPSPAPGVGPEDPAF